MSTKNVINMLKKINTFDANSKIYQELNAQELGLDTHSFMEAARYIKSENLAYVSLNLSGEVKALGLTEKGMILLEKDIL